MELLISILMYLGVFATPDMLKDADFCTVNQETINQAEHMASSGNYQERDGIVITGDVGGFK